MDCHDFLAVLALDFCKSKSSNVALSCSFSALCGVWHRVSSRPDLELECETGVRFHPFSNLDFLWRSIATQSLALGPSAKFASGLIFEILFEWNVLVQSFRIYASHSRINDRRYAIHRDPRHASGSHSNLAVRDKRNFGFTCLGWELDTSEPTSRTSAGHCWHDHWHRRLGTDAICVDRIGCSSPFRAQLSGYPIQQDRPKAG